MMPAPTHDSWRATHDRRTHPGMSWCLRCGWTWGSVTGHNTPYGGGGSSCFPLCVDCWQMLTPAEREPYYFAMMRGWEEWDRVGEDTVFAIIAAVRAGR